MLKNELGSFVFVQVKDSKNLIEGYEVMGTFVAKKESPGLMAEWAMGRGARGHPGLGTCEEAHE